ncbi:hypothetical protein BDA99DRAFT_535680 [Phascolomyces articulosus]|uniref:Uncharacterized protein n=1 Tax=Phascolomyces articulosus TaxID=60185 RepID=A0AAD5KDU3_9FUNG|nr:hypothetical protein BDA99DRAFT_535680 [Phascolomyces articulosus]
MVIDVISKGITNTLSAIFTKITEAPKWKWAGCGVIEQQQKKVRLENDLPSLVIDPKHNPGSDLMKKRMLEEKRIMNYIPTSIVDELSFELCIDICSSHSKTQCSSSLPRAIIEVGNTLNSTFIHRLQLYCDHIYNKFDIIDPGVFTNCIKSIRENLDSDINFVNIALRVLVIPFEITSITMIY